MLDFPIQVPRSLLRELGECAGVLWSDSLAMEPFICAAIRAYIKAAPAQPHESKERTSPVPGPSSSVGYQWKEVFLPEGTSLRAYFDQTPYFAMVEGADIRYGEHSVSPSRFANMRGSGNRNACKAIWLRRPDDKLWLLADVCRAAQKAAIGRLLVQA